MCVWWWAGNYTCDMCIGATYRTDAMNSETCANIPQNAIVSPDKSFFVCSQGYQPTFDLYNTQYVCEACPEKDSLMVKLTYKANTCDIISFFCRNGYYRASSVLADGKYMPKCKPCVVLNIEWVIPLWDTVTIARVQDVCGDYPSLGIDEINVACPVACKEGSFITQSKYFSYQKTFNLICAKCSDWDCPTGQARKNCVHPQTVNYCSRCTQNLSAGQVWSDSDALCMWQCTYGYFLNIATQTCSTCRLGTYKPTIFNETACTLCQVGYYANSAANSACLQCPRGQYASKAGSSACLDCMPGKYSDQTNSTVCLQCPPGTFTTSNASLQCSACSELLPFSILGGTKCGLPLSPCPPGFYFFDYELGTCEWCPPGT